MNKKINYGTAIRHGFEYLLENYDDVFIIGQGLWSPWYVGNTMTDLDKKFGKNRIIDTPVSEAAVTGAAVGASLVSMKPIVVHPRMDFMLYAMDPIVNQAAKWSTMTGGQNNPAVTIRSIINRGGEQGAQHSQSLHNWFVHIPGLKVVMPSSVADARDLLISSVLCKDPVVFIDDRWLYEIEDNLEPIKEIKLEDIKPQLMHKGNDCTVVSSSYSTYLAIEASKKLEKDNIKIDLYDLRVLNPFDHKDILNSFLKTKKLIVIDGGTKTGGFSSEVITRIYENIDNQKVNRPMRITLPDAPAPTANILEQEYYFSSDTIYSKIKSYLSME